MDIRIKLLENCSSSVLRDASKLLKSEAYFPQPRDILPNGRILLRAKMRDSFNFVDHPLVEIDGTGESVSMFRCDCPDYRANHALCVHCVALLLDIEDETHLIQSAATTQEAESEPVDVGEERPKEDLQTNEELPCLMDFSYQFCNSSWDLYPRIREPRIPLERYIQAFGDNARARSLYRMDGRWGGSCYGISATSSMFQQSNEDTRISDFNESAKIPSELHLEDCHQTLGMTLHQFIELVHILQYSKCINYEIDKNLKAPNCMEMLTRRVKEFQQGKLAPVVMCVWKNPELEGGHAVMPYRLETVSDSEDILHIYDPNRPLVTSCAYLQKDDQGNYLNWRFPMSENDVYSSNETGAKVSMTPYEVYKTAWDKRGSSEVDNILGIKSGVAVKNIAGELLVRVTASGVESCRDDVYQIPVMQGSENGNVMISLPAGQYNICQEDPQENELSVHLAGTDLSVLVTTTSREAVVQVEDRSMIASVQIPQPNSHYAIEILNTSGQMPEEVFLNGVTGTEKLHLVQKDGQLYADGLATRCTLYINDAQQSLDCIGQLTEKEIPEKREEEMVLNATPADKKAGNEV